MSEFEIHVGRINTLYKSVWGSIAIGVDPVETEIRQALLNATQTVCDSQNQYVSLTDYALDYEDITVNWDSGYPIQFYHREWKQTVNWSANTWLLSHQRFEVNGRVYEWNSGILLQPGESEFDTFFAFAWAKVDFMNPDGFLDYHFHQSQYESKKAYCSYLRKLVVKYRLILPKDTFTSLINEYEQESKSEIGLAELPEDGKTLHITLPRMAARSKNDETTLLNQKETLNLFHYLRELNVILKDRDYLKDVNFYKALQILTGYDHVNMRKDVVTASINKTELENIKKTMRKVIVLIDNELDKKMAHRK